MSRQLDDPRFDPENDEWVGGRPMWDNVFRDAPSAAGRPAERSLPTTVAPALELADFLVIHEVMSKAGLSMTYERCADKLHERGLTNLGPIHIQLVAELTGVRSATRTWSKVPAAIRRRATTLAARREKQRSRRR